MRSWENIMAKYLTVGEKPNDKVLMVLGTFDVGGAETFVLNLLRAGEQFDAACVIPDHGSYEDEMNALGCRTYHMTRRSVSMIRHHIDLYRIIHENGYKTIYFHTQNAFLTSLHILVAKLAGAKTIVVHSHNTKDWRDKKASALHEKSKGFLYRHSDIRLACGKDAAEWLFGTDRGVQIIPLPVMCDKFSYSDEKKSLLRKWYGIPEDTTVYLHVGRFDTVKNHAFLLDVFAAICKKDPKSLLMLAGTGEHFDEMQVRAKALGISDKVRFLGLTDKVPDFCILADKMIFPSLYEGFPTVLLEAQAAGLPCFVSDTIDKDIEKMPESVKFISLNKKADAWAEEILLTGNRNEEERIRIGEKIRDKYDISAVVKELRTAIKR